MEKVPPYTVFAQVYDHLMKHVNYEYWSRYILNSFPSKNVHSVLDLGCGTGELLLCFPKEWKKTGIDCSEAMLEIARRKVSNSYFLLSSIADFKMDEKFDLIVCTHDAVNYLLNKQELENFVECVYQHLHSGGYFFFDLKSEYNLKEVFHKKTIRKMVENIAIDWKNEYNEKERIIYSYLTFAWGGKLYHEEHRQKYYSPNEIEEILNRHGLELIKMGSDYETWIVTSETYLITCLARKRG